jgi:hypothetical protein
MAGILFFKYLCFFAAHTHIHAENSGKVSRAVVCVYMGVYGCIWCIWVCMGVRYPMLLQTLLHTVTCTLLHTVTCVRCMGCIGVYRCVSVCIGVVCDEDTIHYVCVCVSLLPTP